MRFKQLETKHQTLFDHILHRNFRLVFGDATVGNVRLHSGVEPLMTSTRPTKSITRGSTLMFHREDDSQLDEKTTFLVEVYQARYSWTMSGISCFEIPLVPCHWHHNSHDFVVFRSLANFEPWPEDTSNDELLLNGGRNAVLPNGDRIMAKIYRHSLVEARLPHYGIGTGARSHR